MANKGLETLIIGGIDYGDTLQYRDSLIWDEDLKKEQIIPQDENEECNSPFIDYVIAYAKTLKGNEYGVMRNSKDIWKVMPFDTDKER